MTNKKSTKKALLTSTLCLLLCMSMLVGTTFAWFSDSVSTNNNLITAGNLDVNLYWSTDAQNWAEVKADTNVFMEDTLWEPGHTEVVYLKVVNEGTLALKYDLNVNVDSEVEGTNVYQETFKLSDYILYNVKDGVETYANSAEARGDETGAKLNAPYNKATTLEAGKETVLTMVVFMPTTVGNEANYLHETVAPSINLGINLFATQFTKEQDSYGPNYDDKAYTPVNSQDFKDAITANDKEIFVVLTEDVTYDVAAWENNAMGGAQTETIIINGNGHTITFNHTDSDWNNIVANGAKLIINNAHITNSGHNNGPWNRHDLNFGCDVELNNVTTDKALAFKANATINNVVIDDANTSDTYAIWIQPNGQTVNVNGCTIDMMDCTDGRGIKIDQQYLDAADVRNVTLNVSNTTFKTEEKAAILVKSIAGAAINLSNVNIANTADPAHAVWVDEDSAAYVDQVTVTGGQKFYEGDVVSSSTDLNAAIANGESTIVLGSGTYTLPGAVAGKTMTFAGNADTVVELPKSLGVNGANLTFNGVTVKSNGGGFDSGIKHAGEIVYNNATIIGSRSLYGTKEVFNNCTFDLTGITDYIWTYGAKEVEFNNCTFNTNGKAILIYNEGNGLVTKVTVKGCTFNATQSALASGATAAAIEIDSSLSTNGHYTLITENNTVDSDFSGEWRIKKSGTDNTTVNGVVYNAVTIDGVKVN